MRKSFRDFLPDYAYLLSIAGASLALDQYTKWLVRANMPLNGVWRDPAVNWLVPYARIVHWKNEGAAFGLFQSGGSVFMVLAVIVALVIINYFPIVPRHDRWLRLALALQLGGALGNFIDRVTIGHVTDFVSLWNFPVFNVADASISIGTAFILVPLFPILLSEFKRNEIARQARSRNEEYRQTPSQNGQKEVEIYSLGVMEHILYDVPQVKTFVLNQKVKEIRERRKKRRSGSAQ